MISVVIYGRNDSYGYNLHKRVALSINNMAEVLTDPLDEILFVDYNTPDDFPTLPEAIEDTLTEAAKAMLRIIRVRGSVHERFSSITHLNALEPISRNAAIRRSNPLNRWILSTNTDMIFVPRGEQSLTEICRNLPDGHYGIPRMEVPETLWEHLDRKDPQRVIEQISSLSWSLHLNECVYGEPPHNFDAPGDFQLMLREDMFEIDGFHEGMLLGWHLDSNIAKRLAIKRGEVSDLSELLFGYHCDHTRQVTPMHKADSPSNSIQEFITDVVSAGLPQQHDEWGLAFDQLEEVSLLGREESYLNVLDHVLVTKQTSVTTSFYRSTYAGINQRGSDEHILPFLYDIFSSRRRDARILWIGKPSRLFDLFCNALELSGFDNLPKLVQPTITVAENIESEHFDFFIFDFDWQNSNTSSEFSDEDSLKLVYNLQSIAFADASRVERGHPPRLFIGINTVANRFERIFLELIGASKTPFSTRIRHGYIHQNRVNKLLLAATESQDWSPKLRIGAAGKATTTGISNSSGISGHVIFGPYAHLRPGRYSVTVNAEALKRTRAAELCDPQKINLEIVSLDTVLASATFRRTNNKSVSSELIFEFDPSSMSTEDALNGIQIRCSTSGEPNFVIREVICSPILGSTS